ncbi:MAG: hypothetical protein HRF40_11460 [Nitrososphaera sp.]
MALYGSGVLVAGLVTDKQLPTKIQKRRKEMSTTSEARSQQESDPFAQIEALAASQSKFLKIQPGQTVQLKFDKTKFKPIEREINGRKSKAVEYTVVTPDNQQKVLTLSLQWALALNALLKAGYTNIKASRRGAGLDTNYTFVPA